MTRPDRRSFLHSSPPILVCSAAVGVITARNPVHAALCLVLAFFTSAGLWLLLQAEFLAIALVLVYVGAVMVLFLFVVMMLDINFEQLREGFGSYLPVGATRGRADAGGDGAGADRRQLARPSTRRSPTQRRQLQQHRAAGQRRSTPTTLLPVRNRRGDPAGGDHRGHRADAARGARTRVDQNPARAGARRERRRDRVRRS